jgi:hypothetical protein
MTIARLVDRAWALPTQGRAFLGRQVFLADIPGVAERMFALGRKLSVKEDGPAVEHG